VSQPVLPMIKKKFSFQDTKLRKSSMTVSLEDHRSNSELIHSKQYIKSFRPELIRKPADDYSNILLFNIFDKI
jgi:hypothetical protein